MRHTAAAPATVRTSFALRLGTITGALAILVAAGGAFYYHAQRTTLRHAIWRELETVADLKVRQLTEWRNERLNDARFLMRTSAVAKDVAALLAEPDSTTARADVTNWLAPMKGGERYEALVLLNSELTPLLSIPGDTPPRGSELTAAVAATFKSGQLAFTDLHRSAPSQAVHLDMVVPLFPSDHTEGNAVTGKAAPMAMVIMRLNAEHYLFPLLQNWPTPSASAETILARKEGEEILYLNELRHRSETALQLRRRIDDPQLPAAMGARGESGTSEGMDYRGMPVLAAVRLVPDTGWFLVAKIDQEEAYRPIRKEAWTVGLGVVVLMVGLTGSMAYLWRMQNENVLRRTLAAEQEARVLAERLALLTRHANDMIVIADEALRIVEANDAALATYGYTLEEIRTLLIADLRTKERRDAFQHDMAGVLAGGGAVFETVHQRKDGTPLTVEVSGRLVAAGDRRYVLGIIRDTTERKNAELALREAEERYRSLFENNHAILLLVDALDGQIVDANPQACRYYGWSRAELQGKKVSDINLLSATEVQGELFRARAHEKTRFEFRHRRADGSIRNVEVESGPLSFAGRRLLISVVHDMTERNAAEAALKESEERLRLFIQHAPAALAMFDREMRYIDASLRWISNYKLGNRPLRGHSHYEVFPEIDDDWKAIHRRALAGEVVRAEEDRFLRTDGSEHWLRWEVRPWQDASGNIGGILVFSEDITERKTAEHALAAQVAELRRWHAATLGREQRILELKEEVNQLLRTAGHSPRYSSVETT